MLVRGTGYRHRSPTLTERAESAWRGRRVTASFQPSKHPPFPALFQRFGPLDQGQLSACTGFGVAMGATLQAVAGGLERDVALSPMLPYWAARRRRVASDELVVDDGAYVEDVVWAFNALGASDDLSFRGAFQHLSSATVNQRPPAGELRVAQRLRSELRLTMRTIVADGDGSRLAQRLAHSLDLGQVCFLALPVADSLLDPGPRPIPAQRLDRSIGYHFVCLLDWRRAPGGHYELLCGNSWGSGWGDYGTAWLSPGLVGQSLGAWYLESWAADGGSP